MRQTILDAFEEQRALTDALTAVRMLHFSLSTMFVRLKKEYRFSLTVIVILDFIWKCKENYNHSYLGR